MPRIVTGASAEDAWRQIGHVLLKDGHQFNVIAQIEKTAPEDPLLLDRISAHLVSRTGEKARNVANTIFPSRTWTNSSDRNDFYNRYAGAYRRLMRGSTAWGTYFNRLIRFGPAQANQLETAINALRRWPVNVQAAITLHLSSADTDNPRPRGGPCWHFAQFVCPERDRLELVAVYRNHDFYNKALANYVGLSRLLEFVAAQTNRTPGRLICHSVHAYHNSSKATFRALLNL